MTYPEPRYLGDGGELSATHRPTDHAPDLGNRWIDARPAISSTLSFNSLSLNIGVAFGPMVGRLAFADFIDRGELDHHLRRMRSIYRHRRDRLLEALDRHLPELRPVGVSAGLHVLAWLPPELDEERIVAAGLEAGIGISGLASRRIAPGPGGLIFGDGGITESAIEAGVRLLAEVIASTSRELAPGAPVGGHR